MYENVQVKTVVDLMEEWGCESVEEFVIFEEAFQAEAELEEILRLYDIAEKGWKGGEENECSDE